MDLKSYGDDALRGLEDPTAGVWVRRCEVGHYYASDGVVGCSPSVLIDEYTRIHPVGLLGLTITLRVVMLKIVKADRTTWKLWSSWLMGLPYVKN